MCKRPIDVYMPVKTAINQECFKLGQLPTRDTILNGEFKGDLEECAFTCRFYSLCQGFSFNKTNGICYLQSRFSYSEISQAQGMISGPKQPCGTNNEQKDCWIDPFIQSFSNVLFSENLLLILKQDFSNPEADCPNLFDFEAEESISFNQDKDPANVHLYSNAAELVHLRNEENKFNFVVSYPLTSRSLKWTQASDPFLTSSVQGFEDFTSEVEMCVFLNFLAVKILKLN